MSTIINQLIRSNYAIFKKVMYRNRMNEKTGISDAERQRILLPENRENSKITLFSRDFFFTSSTAFLHSVDEIFGEDIYKFSTPNQKPYIIDCGANMGLSTIYFKRQHPDAEIDAFEPDANIAEVLQKNVTPYNKNQDIRIHTKAVWSEETILEFVPDGGLSGKIVTASEGVVTCKIPTVDLKKYLQRPVDFLKIDIEGAENDLIFDLQGHLQQVRHLFLEYHGMINEKQNLGDILNLIKNEGFEYYIRVAGETLRFPFCGELPKYFNQQLNIFCYRK